ncbi:hypothetical protein Tco_0589478, partial [Tanacetum coccineum]
EYEKGRKMIFWKENTIIPSDNVTDEAVNKEMYDSLLRAATTATSLDAE